jgi:hypothetical protein
MKNWNDKRKAYVAIHRPLNRLPDLSYLDSERLNAYITKPKPILFTASPML